MSRKLKKAARREFFIFIAGVSRDEAQTGYLPACEMPNVLHRFCATDRRYLLASGASKPFFPKKSTWGTSYGCLHGPLGLKPEGTVISAD